MLSPASGFLTLRPVIRLFFMVYSAPEPRLFLAKMIRFYWAVSTLWLAVVLEIASNPISPDNHHSLFSTTTTRQGDTSKTRPNFVVILTDDLDISLGSHASTLQRTRRLIGKEGVTFTNWFVQSPVCCMSVSTVSIFSYDQRTSHLILELSSKPAC